MPYLFKEYKILTLTGILIHNLSILIHSKKNEYVRSFDVHTFNTRQQDNFRIPKCRLSISQSVSETLGLKIYNKLPPNIKSRATLGAFRRDLKMFLYDRCFYTMDEFFNDTYV
ncbi:unnamed protein product [Callosobruchus maculatus]|uniref:Uncharacterized protein n=1 Tax=Callosobruchus maculatus TaxID=64391 RepID=A0A653D6H6_CALMS|nr:unnamed protein product [Callosobruchus maculatus]